MTTILHLAMSSKYSFLFMTGMRSSKVSDISLSCRTSYSTSLTSSVRANYYEHGRRWVWDIVPSDRYWDLTVSRYSAYVCPTSLWNRIYLNSYFTATKIRVSLQEKHTWNRSDFSLGYIRPNDEVLTTPLSIFDQKSENLIDWSRSTRYVPSHFEACLEWKVIRSTNSQKRSESAWYWLCAFIRCTIRKYQLISF